MKENKEELTLRNLQEEEILRKIRPLVGTDFPFNEDVTSTAMRKKADSQEERIIINSDMFVESTDRPPEMQWNSVSWKAITASLSDFAAKGVSPEGLVLSVGFSPDMKLKDLDLFLEGVSSACNYYGVPLLGGDLNEAKEAIVDCTVIGRAKIEKVVKRSTAEIDDFILCTGNFGYTAGALQILLEGKKSTKDQETIFLKAFFYPVVRLDFGKRLAEEKLVSAAIDSSDGLAISLHYLAESSNKKLCITHFPENELVAKFAKQNKTDVKELTLFGGEEYELVFTVSSKNLERVQELSKELETPVQVIGRVKEGNGVTFQRKKENIKGIENTSKKTGKCYEYKIAKQGYSHFKRS